MQYGVQIPIALTTFSDVALYDFCMANRNLRIEREPNGQITIMPPTGGFTSNRNFKLLYALGKWQETYQEGVVFDSSGGFILSDRSMRSPDAAWISTERWESLSQKEKEKFPPLCPDFVIELRSSSDRLQDLREKMEEWIANGCQLAWLIDPAAPKAYIYRLGKEVEEIEDFDQSLTGEDILKGFELKLSTLL